MNVGPLIVSVLSEAVKKFGRITPENQDLVSRWVRKRVIELRDGKVKSAAEPGAEAPSGTVWRSE